MDEGKCRSGVVGVCDVCGCNRGIWWVCVGMWVRDGCVWEVGLRVLFLCGYK